jgi:hypothetical protein
MISRTYCNLKLSKFKRLTAEFEGALTYRTIQFSKNYGHFKLPITLPNRCPAKDLLFMSRDNKQSYRSSLTNPATQERKVNSQGRYNLP